MKPKKSFVLLKWKNPHSSGVRIRSKVMKKSLRLNITPNGIKTKEGRKPLLLLRIKRNGNLEILHFERHYKIPEYLISFKPTIIRDGTSSFWFTIESAVRSLLEFKNRKGKLYGFYQFVNRENHIEMKPVFKKPNEN